MAIPEEEDASSNAVTRQQRVWSSAGLCEESSCVGIVLERRKKRTTNRASPAHFSSTLLSGMGSLGDVWIAFLRSGGWNLQLFAMEHLALGRRKGCDVITTCASWKHETCGSQQAML